MENIESLYAEMYIHNNFENGFTIKLKIENLQSSIADQEIRLVENLFKKPINYNEANLN